MPIYACTLPSTNIGWKNKKRLKKKEKKKDCFGGVHGFHVPSPTSQFFYRRRAAHAPSFVGSQFPDVPRGLLGGPHTTLKHRFRITTCLTLSVKQPIRGRNLFNEFSLQKALEVDLYPALCTIPVPTREPLKACHV